MRWIPGNGSEASVRSQELRKLRRRPSLYESCSCSSSCSLSSFNRCFGQKRVAVVENVNEGSDRCFFAAIHGIDNDHEHENERDLKRGKS